MSRKAKYRWCTSCGGRIGGSRGGLFCSNSCRDVELGYCECGRPKTNVALQCTQCKTLDGANVRQGGVISALQSLGEPSSIEAIVQEMGASQAEVPRRVLNRLRRTGRVQAVSVWKTHSKHLLYFLVEPCCNSGCWDCPN